MVTLSSHQKGVFEKNTVRKGTLWWNF